MPSVEAFVEVDGVLAGDHLVLPGAAGALLLLRHLVLWPPSDGGEVGSEKP
jgi:hypothetical protein